MSKNSESAEKDEIVGYSYKFAVIAGYAFSFILIFIQIVNFQAQEFISISSLLALLGLIICLRFLNKKKENPKIRFHFKIIQTFLLIWIIIFLIRILYLRFFI